MKKQNKQIGLLSFILYLFSQTINAAPAPIITSTQGKSDTNSRFGIGITTSIAKRPFTGVDTQNASLPYLSYRHKDFYIEGLDLGYNFYKNKGYNISIFNIRYFDTVPRSRRF